MWVVDVLCKGLLFYSQTKTFDASSKNSNPANLLLSFAIFLLSSIMLFLNCWSDVITNPSYLEAEKPCPYLKSSFLNRVLYSWCTPLILKGFRKDLNLNSLWSMMPSLDSKTSSDLFDRHYTPNSKSAGSFQQKSKGKLKYSVLPALIKCFWPTFLYGALMKLGADILSLLTPQIMKMMIQFAEIPNQDEVDTTESWKGYFYGFLLLVTLGTQSILQNQYLEKMFLLGMKARTTLTAVIYKKSLLVPLSTRKESSIGEIVNLMSVDVQRIMDVFPYINMIWSAALQITVSAFFMYKELKEATFLGIGILIFLMPLNFILGHFMKVYQIQQMKLKDQRIKMINEILNGMKVLKLYAWEETFIEDILQIRTKEINILRKNALLNALMSLFWTVAPFTVGLGAFTYYVLIGNTLTADNAFVTLSYLNIIRVPLAMLPMMILLIIQVSVSLKRINTFMNTEELDLSAISHDDSVNNNSAVSMQNVSLKWSIDEPYVLEDIYLEAPKGSLIAIVGSVGSGKTSLLSGILGELDIASGSINTQGNIAYVPQQPWIQHSTLKDNITFGKDVKADKYMQVLADCALTKDLEILPAGDQTEIGEKGINLSGGQKQRVSLARAVYSDADLYLLDDPLSAVDSHVGKHIFDHVIGPNGVLNKHTRILVTHGISFLPETDHIIVLANRTISEQGSYEELVKKKGNFAKFLLEYQVEDDFDADSCNLETISMENLTSTSSFGDSISSKSNVIVNGKLSDGNAKNDLVQKENIETRCADESLCFLCQSNWTTSLFSVHTITGTLHCIQQIYQLLARYVDRKYISKL